MDDRQIREVMRGQAGVISRRQVLAADGDDNDIERKIRRREWTRVHEGTYLDHTGATSWVQSAWAAVLLHWPSALSHDSALVPTNDRLALCRPLAPGEVIHVALDPSRRVMNRPGIRAHRLSRWDERTMWNVGPPRMRLEEALLDAGALRSQGVDALALVADACQSRRTTPERMRDALGARERVRHGAWLRRVLDDVAAGVRSVLEHGYLVRVERAHGLPRARRQGVDASGSGHVYRDVEYDAYGLIVELDGRLGHERTHDRWADLDRDIDAQVGGATTIRLSWQQVFGEPCRVTVAVTRLLHARGWAGSPHGCGDPSCTLAGRSPAPQAGDPPRGRQRPG